MSGLFAVQGPQISPASPELTPALVRAVDMMAHRGAHRGMACHAGAALACRHRPIVGLNTPQPLGTPDGRYTVITNGVIYNFRELREQLRTKGHVFTTDSDAEVALYGYAEWGTGLAERIRGACSLILWDDQARNLWVLRDRYGERDLFYTQVNDQFVVATEAKALLAWPGVQARPNLLGIHDYLTFRFAVAPQTCFETIERLRPARWLMVHDGRIIQETVYWKRARIDPGLAALTLDQAAERTVASFDEALRYQSVADVPVGAFLSGGVDSGAIVARLIKVLGHPIDSYCAGFGIDSVDETEVAREQARMHGSTHHEFVMDMSIADAMPELAWYYGEPFADSSALATYALNKQAVTKMGVALGGDGAEQVFIGAKRYDTQYRLRQNMAQGVDAMPNIPSITAAFGKPRMRDAFMSNSSIYDTQHKMRGYGAALAPYLFNPSADRLGIALETCAIDDVMDVGAEIDAQNLLMANFLVKNDASASAAGLETRMPFLDHVFSDCVTAIPHQLRVFERYGERRLKALLRYAMEPWLPNKALYGKKSGFGVPIRHWMRDEMRPLVEELLLDQRFKQRELMNETYVSNMIKDHVDGTVNNTARLWALMMLELWFRSFIDQPVSGPVSINWHR